MLAPFPTPVLSIASDAVKDLEGRDALLGLWICRLLLRGIIYMLIYTLKCLRNVKNPCKTHRDWRTSHGDFGIARCETIYRINFIRGT